RALCLSPPLFFATVAPPLSPPFPTRRSSDLVGACAAVALLFTLKDFRLLAILPIVAAVFIVMAPGQIAKRYASMFNMNDPTVVEDRKSTRLNSSHGSISYAVFCLAKNRVTLR